MVSSEATPFAKSGGLADAVSALTRALSRAGHDVRIVVPRYSSINTAGLEAIPGYLDVPVGISGERVSVFTAFLPDSAIPVYFLDHEGFFGREGIYGNREEPDFADNPQRFALFSRASFQLCRALKWYPDVFHAHDWPAAFVPVFRRYLENSGEFARSATVLTIHNLGYQGVFPKEIFPWFRLPWILYAQAGFEHFDSINLLKAGISCADQLSTVSPTYAHEIQTPEYGCGLDSLLRVRSSDLVGILNGVDLNDWDPSTDKYLPEHFSTKDFSGKALCKVALQRQMGLSENPAVPLFGMVARLTGQKGIDELFNVTNGSARMACADMQLQMAILGSGEAWCEEAIVSLASRMPNFRAVIGYSDQLSHLIEAGSDFFLMPSRYEPCGLNQLYSLRYGTLPLVRRTGGLADTVENYDQESGEGTGFVFNDLTPRSVYDTIGWAVWAFYNKPDHIKAMRARAMSREFSWDASAMEYAALYERAQERETAKSSLP